METLHVQVWSDIACPWCYIGKRRLEAAIGRVARDVSVDVVWRSFELDPSAPREQPAGTTYAARLARKYGISESDAQARIGAMTEVAAADGLEFQFDRIRPGNTFDAHRLLHLAAERGIQDALKERFFRAYFTEGAAIGAGATLAAAAVEAGLPRDEVDRVLATDAYGSAVRADEAEAQRLGIHAVPFFVLANRYGVSGAQPSDVLVQAIRRAAAEARPDGAAAPACGPDGCD